MQPQCERRPLGRQSAHRGHRPALVAQPGLELVRVGDGPLNALAPARVEGAVGKAGEIALVRATVWVERAHRGLVRRRRLVAGRERQAVILERARDALPGAV